MNPSKTQHDRAIGNQSFMIAVQVHLVVPLK